jgi:hypothetical protein
LEAIGDINSDRAVGRLLWHSPDPADGVGETSREQVIRGADVLQRSVRNRVTCGFGVSFAWLSEDSGDICTDVTDVQLRFPSVGS